MQSIIIMPLNRIQNQPFKDKMGAGLKEFDNSYLQHDILPRRAIEMCDVFIVTTWSEFIVKKCRIADIPMNIALPISYLKHTNDLIQQYYDEVRANG